MSPNTKHIIALFALVVGFIVEVTGLGLIEGSFGDHSQVVKGAIYAGIGLLIGLPAAIYHYYYQQQQKWMPPQSKVDVETLSALAPSKKPPTRK
ncbi:MAG TPA: hypothetical protein VFW90_02540 [Candidatus Saccharimonadales bacterium]|nr:hypothetical protein [Candidatus Saccharimonadales bacterium]